ncbi:Gfo/Idh/MocA family protein [Humisphaera borealis]|uniref:Gfo/Idh/MocA family oxidoreductase n=1 Tax=Humisphaera borealis TaxID=2807512 RepID=A0A7M2WXR0_9BACT|nr:Gfo/Idh/MocA family oxidoreductase [Humisphaera borealis]QOV90144.1 Gfo/Idh/MocA family oxidoreductase [Humisphaera borealis]
MKSDSGHAASTSRTTVTPAIVDPAHSRRDVLKMSTAAAVAAAAASWPLASAVYAAGSDQLKYGLIGCGGRGSGAAANAMHADSTNKLVAMADLWPDKVKSSHKNLTEELGQQMDVPADRQFSGFDAYKAVLEVSDVVILATPPHFRPMHLEAALNAGKHVFCEKPVGTDVPSVKRVMALGEKAKEKNLNLVSGLCYRYDIAKKETMAKIHAGEIGDIVNMQGMYLTGGLWMNKRQDDWGDMEWQLRNWLYFTWLSGDHIVEQHIHTLDKLLWTMKDVPPTRVTGNGGRTVRTDPAYGHIYDHFDTIYEWDSEDGPPVKAFCQTRQWVNCAVDTSDWIYGTKGRANLMAHQIWGEKAWKRKGKSPNMYDTEHEELTKAIKTGKTINNTDYMCKSTLMGIMGRMAAYTGQTITWEKMLESTEDLTPPTYDPKAKYPTPPVAVPGVTKFA